MFCKFHYLWLNDSHKLLHHIIKTKFSHYFRIGYPHEWLPRGASTDHAPAARRPSAVLCCLLLLLLSIPYLRYADQIIKSE